MPCATWFAGGYFCDVGAKWPAKSSCRRYAATSATSQCRTGRPRPEAILIDTAPLAMPLGALGPIEDPTPRGAR